MSPEATQKRTPDANTPAPALPADYLERAYAGVLGKIIGVYLGRPVEGWTYERILAELGETTGYLNDRLGVPLVVTDDDISGTFTFLRALEDYGYDPDLSAAQIGQTWLNYLLEGRTILWWGGLGMSTEHTAYLRLKRGVPAPHSGSIALNGTTVAEQIGAQIFIEGWGMVSPGNPAQAADLARRAASVSHDGEAIYAAQVIAVMAAQAFVEPELETLLDTALGFIPPDSTIARLIADLRRWRLETDDWHEARRRVAEQYGYDKYPGNCHVVPNHAVVILALLWGDGDFSRSLRIANTCGWDTDCNAANVGCILGIRGGLGGIGPEWRGPVADRLYLPTADGGRAVSDAAQEALRVVNAGRALAGLGPVAPKGGARFHFELPGSVQSFEAEDSFALFLENTEGHSLAGCRSLRLSYRNLEAGRPARAAVATFTQPEVLAFSRTSPYEMIASPTLYAGQTVRAGLEADGANAQPVRVRLYLRHFDPEDELVRVHGPSMSLEPGRTGSLVWPIPDRSGLPIEEVGIELDTELEGGLEGSVYLDFLTWDGAPDLLLAQPAGAGEMWRRAWVSGVDKLDSWQADYRLVQNSGRGLISQGTREWTDYRVEATVTPNLCTACGLAVRVQGMRRYYALLLKPDRLQLVKALEGERVLAEATWSWNLEGEYRLALEAVGSSLRAWVDGRLVFETLDTERPLVGGAVGLAVEEGMMGCGPVRVRPVEPPR